MFEECLEVFKAELQKKGEDIIHPVAHESEQANIFMKIHIMILHYPHPLM